MTECSKCQFTSCNAGCLARSESIATLTKQLSTLRRELAEERERADAFEVLLEAALTSLVFCKMFIGSRQKMHPTGQKLHEDVCKELKAALTTPEGAADET